MRWLPIRLMFLANADFAQTGHTVLFPSGSSRPHIVLQWMGSAPSPEIVFPETTTSRTTGKLPSKYCSKGEISRLAVPAWENLLPMIDPPLLLKRPKLYLRKPGTLTVLAGGAGGWGFVLRSLGVRKDVIPDDSPRRGE